MKKFKKLTAGLLGVVMALSVCGFTALAEGDTSNGIDSMNELTTALSGSEQTLEITDDFEVDALVSISRSVVINGNGHELTFTGSDISENKGGKNSFIQITGEATVEINDLTIDGNKSVKHCINVYGVGEDTKVKLDGVTMENGNEGYGLVVNSAYVTVKDIETSGNGWGGINVDTAGKEPSKLIVESATINETGEDKSIKIENENNKEIVATIKDGTFKGEVLIAENVESAKLNITGGKFKDKVYVDGENSKSSISITGGTFTTDVSDYIDNSNSAFVKDEDGNYVVADKEAIKNEKFYIDSENDLIEAIEAQTDGVTWVFEDETYDLESTIKITKDITIEGNGAVLSYIDEIYSESDAKERCGIHIDSGANVEINDLTIDGEGNINRHGINVYSYKNGDITSVEVNNVKIVDCLGYAIVNNASKVTVTDLETSGNGWGGINVDNSDSSDAREGGAELIINSANIKDSNSVKIENATNRDIDAVIKDGTYAGDVFIADGVKNAELRIISGTFAKDVEKYIDKFSHIVKIDGEYVVMDEEKYEGYLDSKRPSHSYSLEEGRVDRNDEEEEPVVTTKPEEEAGPFSDVGKDNPNYDAIIKVYEKGWMAGIGDGVFAPNGTLTRAMGATVLWNKAGKPEPQNVAPFLDVTSDAWYAKAVAWAYEQGIVAGYGETFGPGDALTTEQFTRMNDIANGKTPEAYVGGAPNATRGWVASLLAM